MSLGAKLTLNTLIQLVGKFLSVLLGLVVVAIMTRALGTEGFGQYTTIIAFLQLAGILVDLGLTVTAGKLIGQTESNEQKFLSNLFSFRVLTSLVVFSLAPLVAWFFPYPLIVKSGIILASLSFWAASVTQTFGAVFQKYLRTFWFVLAEIIGRLVLLILTVWAAFVWGGLIMFILAVVAGSLVNLLLVLYFSRRLVVFGWEIDFKYWQKIWQETWPVALTISLNLVYFKADTVILSVYHPASEVGIYGASYKVLEVLLAIPTIIGGLLLPLVASLLLQKALAQIRKYYQIGIDSMLICGLGLIALSLAIGPSVMTWLAGKDFFLAGEVLKVVSLATALIFLGNLTGYFILAFSKQKKMIKYYVVAAAFSLVGYFVFIPQYSYWAAAWVTVVIEGFMAIVSFWILHKELPLNISNWPRIFLTAVIFYLVLNLVADWHLLIKLVIGATVYYLLLWLFKVVPGIKFIKQEV